MKLTFVGTREVWRLRGLCDRDHLGEAGFMNPHGKSDRPNHGRPFRRKTQLIFKML